MRTHVADVMARASACAGEWLKLLWRSGCNVDCFLAAAWDFAMLLRFARVESRRAAQIVTIGVARCVWWCRCDALVCARSVSVDSAAMETIGVISWQRSLRWGPGPEIEIGDL